MTELDGFKLTFDDGTVFRAKENVIVSHQGQPLFPIDGFQNFITIYNEYINQGGQDGRSDSNMTGVFAGFGAGIHTIRVEFIGGWEGSSDDWGANWAEASSAGDSAISKLQTLNRALTTKKMDSNAPGVLETGEYNSSGKFNPIPVALGEYDLSFDPEQQSTISQNFINFRDSVDLTQAVSSIARRND